MVGMVELFVALIFVGLIVILPYWKIFSKAGFPGWYSFLLLVPILNLIMIFYLAFAEWPIHKEE